VVIAMSSGLVATMGLPAQAVSAAASHPDAAKQAAAPVRQTTTSTSRSSTRSSRTSAVVAGFGSAKGASLTALAARYLGVPYVFGGESPSGWDCSGAMVYIFGLVGIHLPRTANDQMLATTRISSSQAGPGDLVFFISGGRAYHVGLYAGNGMIFDAGRSGEVFQKRAIWTSSVVYTRVTG